MELILLFVGLVFLLNLFPLWKKDISKFRIKIAFPFVLSVEWERTEKKRMTANQCAPNKDRDKLPVLKRAKHSKTV